MYSKNHFNSDFETMFQNMWNHAQSNISEDDLQKAQAFMTKMCGADFPYQRPGFSCSKTPEKPEDQKQKVFVPLKRFSPENVNVNVNSKGLVTISATSETESETNRNGMRKCTTILEETVQLPEYLLQEQAAEKSDAKETSGSEKADVENETKDKPKKLLDQIECKFVTNGLLITMPEKPVEKEPEVKSWSCCVQQRLRSHRD